MVQVPVIAQVTALDVAVGVAIYVSPLRPSVLIAIAVIVPFAAVTSELTYPVGAAIAGFTSYPIPEAPLPQAVIAPPADDATVI